jgi:hypothetical protein
MWVVAILAGMFAIALSVAVLFLMCGIVFRFFDRIFGDRWML